METEVFDLMCNLGATDEQLEYKTVFASGRDGWASLAWPTDQRDNMEALLDTIVGSVPKPKVRPLPRPPRDRPALVRCIPAGLYRGGGCVATRVP